MIRLKHNATAKRPHCDHKIDREIAKVSERFYWSRYNIATTSPTDHEILNVFWACTKDWPRYLVTQRFYLSPRGLKMASFHRRFDRAAISVVKKRAGTFCTLLTAYLRLINAEAMIGRRFIDDWSLSGCKVVSKRTLIIRHWVYKRHRPVACLQSSHRRSFIF